MKLKDIKSLNLSPKTTEDAYFDHVAAIVDDEFRNRNTKDYRNSAIDRLTKNGLAFWNNINLTHDMVKRFVSIKCPYCG